MDKSLDEVIAASRPKNQRRLGRRNSAKVQLLGNPANPALRAAAQNAAAAKVVAAANPAPQPADKIIVSNLPADVHEAQIKELFHSTIGPLREVTLHYDSAGRWKGSASVHFQRKGDGTKAYQQYNKRLVDGKRPMKIEIVVDPTHPAPAQSLVSRVAPPPASAAAPTATARTTKPASRGIRRARGRARKGNERPQKSAADLDAEMEDYTASNTTTPAAVPVAV